MGRYAQDPETQALAVPIASGSMRMAAVAWLCMCHTTTAARDQFGDLPLPLLPPSQKSNCKINSPCWRRHSGSRRGRICTC